MGRRPVLSKSCRPETLCPPRLLRWCLLTSAGRCLGCRDRAEGTLCREHDAVATSQQHRRLGSLNIAAIQAHAAPPAPRRPPALPLIASSSSSRAPPHRAPYPRAPLKLAPPIRPSRASSQSMRRIRPVLDRDSQFLGGRRWFDVIVLL